MIKSKIYKLKRVIQFLSCEIPIKFIKFVEFPHFVGITISSKTKIGTNCIIYANVTIGGKKNGGKEFPKIGNNVKIYSNSVIIGKIKIGNNVIIGAGSVVLSDIDDNCIVVGNPAKVIKQVK